MQTKKLVVFGLGARGTIYSVFAKTYPEKFDLVAIIENNPERLEYAKTAYPGARLFSNYHDFLAEKIEADIVAIATQDDDHKEHAIAMMQAGYDLLLEKPIANNTVFYPCLDRLFLWRHPLRYLYSFDRLHYHPPSKEALV